MIFEIIFFISGVYYFYTDFHKNKMTNIYTYPSILITFHEFKMVQWIVFLITFYCIIEVLGIGMVSALITLLYLWQRGYEFYHNEHLHVIETIYNTSIDHEGSEYTFSIDHDMSGEFVYPFHFFKISVRKNGKHDFYIEDCLIKSSFYVHTILDNSVFGRLREVKK